MYVETFSSDIWNCRRGEHMTKRVTKKAERKTGQRTVQGRNRADEKFIMLPTVDFCFLYRKVLKSENIGYNE